MGPKYHPWVRMVLVGCLTAVLLGAVTYVLVRLRVTYRLQSDLSLINAEIRDLHKQLEFYDRNCDVRLSELEREVLGQVTPQPPKLGRTGPSRIELWQRNRDQELRDRIRALERWRLGWDQ